MQGPKNSVPRLLRFSYGLKFHICKVDGQSCVVFGAPHRLLYAGVLVDRI